MSEDKPGSQCVTHLRVLKEWILQHKDKKEAQDAELKRKEGIRSAVEPAVAAYEEAKKALKTASAERRAAVRASNDPPPAVGHLVAFPIGICSRVNDFALGQCLKVIAPASTL